MASRGGPKPRKRRPASAGIRAWRSMSPAARKAVKAGEKMTHAQKVSAGRALRQARISRGVDPNKGLKSYAVHAVNRAVATGKVSAADAQKTLGTMGKGGGLNPQFADMVLKQRQSGTSNYGAAIVAYDKQRRVAAKVTARSGLTGKDAAAKAASIIAGRSKKKK